MSCGCERGGTNSLPLGEANFNRYFRELQASADKRGYEFALTENRVREITSQACYYCGAEPDVLMDHPASNGPYIGNGIDRGDNDQGYIPGNVVACCKHCNRAKLTRTAEEFLSWAQRVVDHSFPTAASLTHPSAPPTTSSKPYKRRGYR